ncbi:hypothetical protein Poly59_14800 [Rubripirellula reticaptiva]|uniref:Uncharacterized protein n=2 Tax=Rubripirellula reticaptiva TaxID=2528013 RepID=A0A5C6F3M4_9BACT|nr:hypothetical protein Poly59_14800 [Rubripirellula reticaptiva]
MSVPASYSQECEPMENNAELQGLPIVARPTGVCCASLTRLATPVMALVAVGAISVAAFFAGQLSQTQAQYSANDLPFLHADSAVSSENFSMATGAVDQEAEGLFVLDHNSGLLQCSVIYPRMGRFMSQFTANVADALGTGGKGGSYLMLTGRADFPRSSNNPVGSTIVYVMDTATGNYASYYVPFNRQAMTSGQVQQGLLMLIATGSANPVIDRDALR